LFGGAAIAVVLNQNDPAESLSPWGSNPRPDQISSLAKSPPLTGRTAI